MKRNILRLLSFIIILATGCDPLEDTYNELDKNSASADAVKNFPLTLAKADYELLKTKSGGTVYPATISSGLYFTTPEQAAEYVPDILKTKYPQLADKSSVEVTFNQLVFAQPTNTVSERFPAYTLTNSDYALGGTNFANFDRWLQVETYLKAQYTKALNNTDPIKDGSLVTLTFIWFNTNVNPTSKTVTDVFYYKNGKWYDTYLVSAEEYASIDRGRFNNFVAADQSLLADYFNKFLKAKIVGSKVNDVQYVSFANRPVSTTTQEVMAMVFNGTDWVKAASNITIPSVLKFGKKAGIWKPDLSINYTLATADYQWIGDDANGIGTALNRANLRSFNNFYQQNSSDTRYWTDDQIKSGIAARLKVLYPNAELGQKYLVTYIAYTGSNTTKTLLFEKKESGNYEVVTDK